MRFLLRSKKKPITYEHVMKILFTIPPDFVAHGSVRLWIDDSQQDDPLLNDIENLVTSMLLKYHRLKLNLTHRELAQRFLAIENVNAVEVLYGSKGTVLYKDWP